MIRTIPLCEKINILSKSNYVVCDKLQSDANSKELNKVIRTSEELEEIMFKLLLSQDIFESQLEFYISIYNQLLNLSYQEKIDFVVDYGYYLDDSFEILDETLSRYQGTYLYPKYINKEIIEMKEEDLREREELFSEGGLDDGHNEKMESKEC